MRNILPILFGCSLALSLAQAQETKPAPAASAAKALDVHLNYTGAGAVDEKHRVIVFLFDSPDFTSGSVMPVASQSGKSKDAVVTFSDVSATPVYVAVCFDPAGTYDGVSGPPPSGASMGLYSKDSGTPAPVKLEAGQTVKIEVPFDDSAKMP